MNRLEYQKAELTKVLPKELEASEINVRLGATWIPNKDIEKFTLKRLKLRDMPNGILRLSFQTSQVNGILKEKAKTEEMTLQR